MDTKNPTKLSDLPDKQLAYALLRQQGAKPREAEKALGYKYNSGNHIEKKLKKLGIASPKRLKRAESSLDKLLRGKAFGDIDKINASTVMAAVNAVIDRADPKVTRTENLNFNADTSPVDLSRYLSSGREAREDAREATIEVQGIAGAGEEG